MATFLNDTFTDANGTALGSHVGETGATWAMQSGSTGVATINSNRLYGPASGNGIYYASGIPGAADYTVSAPFTFSDASWPSIFGVAGRMSTGAQTGYFAIWFNSSGKFRLYKYVAGTLTQIGSDRGATKGADTFTVSLILTGTTIAMRVQRSSDSQWLIGDSTWSASAGDALSVTDSSITAAGKAGMWLVGTYSTTGYMGSISGVDGLTSSMSASPTSVVTSSTGAVITLTGVDTSWTGGTTFTVSGVSGTSKTAQNVINGTSATITIDTGATTGTLTISDGTISTQITVIPVTDSISVADTNIFFSPWNWYSDGAGAMQANNVKASSNYAVSNNPGAYLKTKLVIPTGGGPCSLNVDTAHHTGFASASNWPTLQYSVDGGAVVTELLASGQTTVSLGTLAAGTRTVVAWFKSIGEFSIDLWNGTPPPNSVKVTGFTVPEGTTTAAPTLRTNRLLCYGDSITAGFHNLSAASTNAAQNAGYTWAQMVAVALDAEVGIVGFGGQGDSANGIGNVPAATTSYSLYSSGRSRLVSGLLSPAPDYIIANWGENGVNNANYTTLLANIRTAAPSAHIFLVDPFNGNDSLSGVTLPSEPVDRIVLTPGDGDLLDAFTGYQTPVHPDIPGSANIAARLVRELLPLLGVGTGPAFGSAYVDAIYMGSTQIA